MPAIHPLRAVFFAVAVLLLAARSGDRAHAAEPSPLSSPGASSMTASYSPVTPSDTLVALWKTLQEQYPMPEYMGAHGDAWLEEFRPKVAAASTPEAAYDLMDELVCRLNDYHTRFFPLNPPPRIGAPARLEPILRRPLPKMAPNPFGSFRPFQSPPAELPPDLLKAFAVGVTAVGAESSLRLGDEVASVNGVPVNVALAAAWKRSVGSSPVGKLRGACGRLLLGPPDEPLRLEVLRAGSRRPLSVTVPRGSLPEEPTYSVRETRGIPILRIARWSDGDRLIPSFDATLEANRAAPGLVFDVRGNGGGADALADAVTGRFLDHRVVSSVSFHHVGTGDDFRRTVEWAEPRGPWRFTGRVAVLTDEGCASACEHFVSGMSEAGALLVGTATSGACGWSQAFPLPGGAVVSVSRTFPLHTGGLPSPLLGIEPHRWAPGTLDDARRNRDPELAAALDWVTGRAPLPQRSHDFAQ